MGFEIECIPEIRRDGAWVRAPFSGELARRQILFCVLCASARDDEALLTEPPSLPSYRGMPDVTHFDELVRRECARSPDAQDGRPGAAMTRAQIREDVYGIWADPNRIRGLTHFTLGEIDAHPWQEPVTHQLLLPPASYDAWADGQGALAAARAPGNVVLTEAEYLTDRRWHRTRADLQIQVVRTDPLRDLMPGDWWRLVEDLRAASASVDDARLIVGWH